MSSVCIVHRIKNIEIFKEIILKVSDFQVDPRKVCNTIYAIICVYEIVLIRSVADMSSSTVAFILVLYSFVCIIVMRTRHKHFINLYNYSGTKTCVCMY